MSTPYIPPAQGLSAFNCPRCKAYSRQDWMTPELRFPSLPKIFEADDDLQICRCHHCGGLSIWYSQKMLHPEGGSAPLPSPDLPPELSRDFEEARTIVDRSPRGAAALLRLVIQKLCIALGQGGKNINNDIAALVEAGLPVTVQKALDIVRVVGNHAVHPGQIDLRDDPKMAHGLFELVNLIVGIMITQPKQVEELYEELPEAAKKQVEKRDGA